MNLFNSECTCPSTAETLTAAIAGAEIVPTCQTHQADEIAARAEAERIAAIVKPAQDLDAALDGVRAKWDAEQDHAAAEAAAILRESALAALDPLSSTIARAVGAPMSSTSSMPLSAGAAEIASALGGMTSAD